MFTTVPVDHELGPCVLVQGIAVNVRFLLIIFREGAENVFSADRNASNQFRFSLHVKDL